jgi:hypothetical protein
MRRRPYHQVFLAALLSSCFLQSGVASDWPQWLGPDREGVWRESGLLGRFPKGGPTILWRTPVGPGNSGPAVAGGRVYVMDREPLPAVNQNPTPGGRSSSPGKERILCLNETDGKQLWSHAYDCSYTFSYRTGPRATPLIHEGRVYTLGAMGISVVSMRRAAACTGPKT